MKRYWKLADHGVYALNGKSPCGCKHAQQAAYTEHFGKFEASPTWIECLNCEATWDSVEGLYWQDQTEEEKMGKVIAFPDCIVLRA